MKKSSSDSNLKLGYHSEKTEIRVQVWLHLRLIPFTCRECCGVMGFCPSYMLMRGLSA